MRASLIRKCLCVICLSLSFAVLDVSVSFGGTVTLDGIDVSPLAPLVGQPISLTSYGWIGYAASTSFVGSEYSISGNDIVLNSYFIDTNPGGIGIPIAYSWEDTQDIGSLAAGTYNVTSYALMGFPGWPEEISDVHSNSFVVTPEPASVLLFASALGLLRRIRRRFSVTAGNSLKSASGVCFVR